MNTTKPIFNTTRNRFKLLLQVLESENQVENAATEDAQTDVDVDVELIENKNGCVDCCNVM